MNTQKVIRRIFSVKAERIMDNDGDTSWLGEYSDTRTSPFSIDRAHSEECALITYDGTRPDLSHDEDCTYRLGNGAECSCDKDSEEPDCDCGGGDMERNEYRYFNPSFNYVDKSGNPLPDNTPDEVRKYVRQDYERMERLHRGDWCFIGVSAKAQVGVSFDGGKSFKLDTLTSGGLWGIESDSEESYIVEEEVNQLAELQDILLAYGFGRTVVAKAFKKLERVAA